MHICFLASAKSIHLQKWADYFIKKNHKVSVISFDFGEIKGAENYFVNMGIFSKSKLKYILGAYKVFFILKKIKPDIIQVIYLISYGLTGVLSGFRPISISAIGCDVLNRPKESLLKKLLAKYIIKKADLIHSQAEHLTKEIISLGGDEKKIITFSYGIDLKETKRETKKDFSKNEEKIIISTRALEPIYNIETFIYSAFKVLKEMSGIKFWIAGKGEKREEKKLKEIVAKLKLENSVVFLGELSNKKILGLLEKSDIYVSTSLSDGSSISLLEAMAKESFPVVSDIEANREFIKDKENGFLFPLKDSNKLADNILEAISDNDLRKKAAKINQRILEEKGSYQKNMKIIEKNYFSLHNNFKKN